MTPTPTSAASPSLPALMFTNPGELDPRLVTTFGVNIKPATLSPIGYFGTGLKYAIAVAMRLGATLTIFSGTRVLTFATQREMIRGEEVDMIYLHTQGTEQPAAGPASIIPLAFTPSLGKNWEPWMAVRELYCNALDEGGETTFADPSLFDPAPGLTRIFLTGDAFLAAWRNRGQWLLATAPVATFGSLSLHPGASPQIFNGRILAATAPRPMLYTYNIAPGTLTLTEDRTLQGYAVNRLIARSIARDLTDPTILRRILTCSNDFGEHHLDANDTHFLTPSAELLEVLTTLRTTARATMTPFANGLATIYLPEEDPTTLSPTPDQDALLTSALDFLLTRNIRISSRIQLVESLGSDRFRAASDGQVLYLPLTAFNFGRRGLVTSLFLHHLVFTEGLPLDGAEIRDHILDLLMGEWEKGEASALEIQS